MGERDRMLVAARSDRFCERKLKNVFAAAYRYLYTHLFWSLSVTFPYKVILSFFGHCLMTFPNMELFSFFGRFVQKVRITCFSDSFVQQTTHQSDSSCNVTSDSQLLYKLLKKQTLYFCKHIWKIDCE